jgi:hypothetical protein
MKEAGESTRSHNNNNGISTSSSYPFSLIDKIRQIHPRDHDMMIYPDLPTFRKVYSRATKEALERNEIVFLATTYDSFQRVMDSLTQADVSVNKETKEGNLVILDAVKAYQIDIFGAFKFAKSLVMRAAKDGKAGVFNISDMGSFSWLIAYLPCSIMSAILKRRWILNLRPYVHFIRMILQVFLTNSRSSHFPPTIVQYHKQRLRMCQF